ncbi:MAG: hypothetical protein KME46_29845 [Brasilonema angustatum HA4187-MV1]|nr:hypothetical protein [Brasilonema angustatum HA4187-MV1]
MPSALMNAMRSQSTKKHSRVSNLKPSLSPLPRTKPKEVLAVLKNAPEAYTYLSTDKV